MFLITVTGEIIAKDKNHYAQGWACRSFGNLVNDNSYRYDPENHIVQSNLILNKSIRAVPYAYYFTDKGIQAQPPSDLFAAPGAMAAELCYKDNISEIESLLSVAISPEIKVYFYNGLLTGIFSVFELFLSDVILCIIFKNDKVYQRALNHLYKRNKIGKLAPDLAIQRYFTKDIVYHKFDQIKSIFYEILQVKIPDTKVLRPFLHKRNNIAHRFAYSNIDRMTITEIDVDILKDFIAHCNDFVDKLMKEINRVS